MKYTLGILFQLLLAANLRAQELEVVPEPTAAETKTFWQNKVRTINRNGKTGFENPDGSVRVPPIYDGLPNVPTSFMVTKLDGKYGVIDDKNGILVPFGTYDQIDRQEGFRISRDEKTWVETAVDQNNIGLVALKNGLLGLINPAGTVLIPLQYEELRHIGSGYYAACKDGFCTVVDHSNKSLLSKPYNRIIPMYGDYSRLVLGVHEGLLKAPDTLLLPAEYDMIRSGSWPFLDVQKGAMMYQFHTYTHVLTPSEKKPVPIFYESPVKKEGPCAAYIAISKQTGVGYGLKHTEYGMVIPPVYDYVNPSTDCGCFAVTRSRKRGLFGPKGEILLPFEYDFLVPSKKEANIFLATVGEKSFFINTRGERLSDETYAQVEDLYNGYFVVSDGKKKALVHPNGKRITPYAYDGFIRSAKPGIVAQGLVYGSRTDCLDADGKTVHCN